MSLFVFFVFSCYLFRVSFVFQSDVLLFVFLCLHGCVVCVVYVCFVFRSFSVLCVLCCCAFSVCVRCSLFVYRCSYFGVRVLCFVFVFSVSFFVGSVRLWRCVPCLFVFVRLALFVFLCCLDSCVVARSPCVRLFRCVVVRVSCLCFMCSYI